MVWLAKTEDISQACYQFLKRPKSQLLQQNSPFFVLSSQIKNSEFRNTKDITCRGVTEQNS